MTKAMYAFSGDPITFGHIDIIKRAASVFEKVIVGIGINPVKKYMFSLSERTLMAKKSLTRLKNVEVISFDGLLINFAYENDIPVIIRGVRNSEDFSYENILYQVGESQKLGIDTHILFSKPELTHVSSGAVKAVKQHQGIIDEYVPLLVKQQMEAKMLNQYIIGVTGTIGAGKSHICHKLTTLDAELPVHNIELDHIAHHILSELKEPVYQKLKLSIAKIFGDNLLSSDGVIDRKKLGEIIFNDKESLEKLNAIMYTPIMVRLQRELLGKEGIILINAALLAESNILPICNNNSVIIKVDEHVQRERLAGRGLSATQIEKRINSQYSFQKKSEIIKKEIEKANNGNIWTIDNSKNVDDDRIKTLLDDIIKYFKLKP